MTKFFDWFKRNKKPIGYAAGISCFVNGILDTVHGNAIWGAFQFMLGVIILLDSWD